MATATATQRPGIGKPRTLSNDGLPSIRHDEARIDGEPVAQAPADAETGLLDSYVKLLASPDADAGELARLAAAVHHVSNFVECSYCHNRIKLPDFSERIAGDRRTIESVAEREKMIVAANARRAEAAAALAEIEKTLDSVSRSGGNTAPGTWLANRHSQKLAALAAADQAAYSASVHGVVLPDSPARRIWDAARRVMASAG